MINLITDLLFRNCGCIWAFWGRRINLWYRMEPNFFNQTTGCLNCSSMKKNSLCQRFIFCLIASIQATNHPGLVEPSGSTNGAPSSERSECQLPKYTDQNETWMSSIHKRDHSEQKTYDWTSTMLPVHSHHRFPKKAFRLNLAANKSFPLNKFNSKKIHFQEKASLAKKSILPILLLLSASIPFFTRLGKKPWKPRKL